MKIFKNNRLTLEQVANKIKGLVTTSALAKIEIGELLIEYKKDIPHGDKEKFYKSIGMAPTTAQYYMKIARSPEIQRLKTEGKLDGLNMQQIRLLVGIEKNKHAVEPEKYTPLSKDDFKYKSCNSTRILKIQYELLLNDFNMIKKRK